MNEHTRRILARMLMALKQYETGSVSLRSLLDTLEGSTGAVEESLPASVSARVDDAVLRLDVMVAMGRGAERCVGPLEELEQLAAELSQYIEYTRDE